MSTFEITKENFEATLSKNEIVLLDFWATWCGPCRTFGPIFEKVASQHPDIAFGKVNTEDEQELAGAFQVRSIPTVMAFRQGIPIFAQPGLLPEAALEDLIQQIRALDMEDVKRKLSQEEP